MTNPIIMFLSAAIFGYFGFLIGLTPNGPAGEFVFMFGLLLWTLRIGCIGFLAAMGLSLVHKVAGNLFFCIVGMMVAIALVVVGVMDTIDQTYAAAISPLLAFIFAAWNGYASWVGLQEVLLMRRRGSTPPTEPQV